MSITVVRTPLTRQQLRSHALDDDLVKAVVDCRQRIMAVNDPAIRRTIESIVRELVVDA